MSVRIENISKGKVIGIGAENILPGETKTVPDTYKNHPVISFYAEKGFARVTVTDNGGQGKNASVETESGDSPEENTAENDDAAEALRKARLASLKGISSEALGKLAEELGIRPEECRDNADMLKKVRAALKT